MEKIIFILRLIYKAIPYLISFLGGSVLATSVSGCKIGSLVSLVTPTI